MTLLFRDALFQEHETGSHPERPLRLQSIEKQLTESGLIEKCNAGAYRPASAETILTLHTKEQLQLVKEAAAQGGGRIDPDTVVSPKSYDVALAIVGACCTGVDNVVAGKDTNALCLVRPPGHHATENRSMGFCLFNSIALAAEHARRQHGLTRVLIADFDVHHGNGTQDIFYGDGGVTFFSIHRFGFGFYPGTGAADETGTGAGLGHNFNATVTFGTPRDEYHSQFRSMLEKAAKKSKPELVLLSAGFDAHAQDPIGSLGLETEDFATLTREVIDVAKTHSKGRLVCCLEGGYNVQALADSVEVHLRELLKG